MSHALGRSSRLVRWSVVLVTGVSLGAGLVALSAAEAEARPSRAAKRVATVAPSDAASEVPFTDRLSGDAATSPARAGNDPQTLDEAEMLSLVKKYSREIASSVTSGERQREQAIHRKDSIRLACIQDRLSSMKLVKKLADNSLFALARPEIRAEMLYLRHEFRSVEMAHQRVVKLHAELMDCVGETLEVSVSGSGAQAPDSVATDPGGVSVQIPPIDRPSPASAYD